MKMGHSRIGFQGSILKWGLFTIGPLLLSACVSGPVPLDDYTYARAAIEAAKAVEAARYAPGYWNQAEEAYRRAKILLTDKENEEARLEFLKARLAAERAENSARYIRFKNGEIL